MEPRGRPPEDVRSYRGPTRASRRARHRADRAVGKVDPARIRAAAARGRWLHRRARDLALRRAGGGRPWRHAGDPRAGPQQPSRPKWGRASCGSTGTRSSGGSARSRPCTLSGSTARSRTPFASSSSPRCRSSFCARRDQAYLVAASGRVIRPLAHPRLSGLPRLWVTKDVHIAVGQVLPAPAAAAPAALAPLRGASLPVRSPLGARRCAHADAGARKRPRATARRHRRPASEARDRAPDPACSGRRNGGVGVPRRQSPRASRARPQPSSRRLRLRLRQVEEGHVRVDSAGNPPYPHEVRRRSTARAPTVHSSLRSSHIQ